MTWVRFLRKPRRSVARVCGVFGQTEHWEDMRDLGGRHGLKAYGQDYEWHIS
jgi:hypothetical protein